MRRISLLLSTIAVITGFTACNKEKDNNDCSFKAPAIVLVDFSEADRDTIILRRYSNSNSFSNKEDTTLFTVNTIQKTTVGQDSIMVTLPNELFNKNFYSYNWEITMPSTGYFARLSDITLVNSDEQQVGTECHSYISNVKVYESVPITKNYIFPTWVGNQYRIYLTK